MLLESEDFKQKQNERTRLTNSMPLICMFYSAITLTLAGQSSGSLNSSAILL